MAALKPALKIPKVAHYEEMLMQRWLGGYFLPKRLAESLSLAAGGEMAKLAARLAKRKLKRK